MKIEYSHIFIKDLKKLKKLPIYLKLKAFCFEELPAYSALNRVQGLKKIQGYQDYYRIRVGDYRIGVKIDGDIVIVLRILHRKDIYRYFP